jgi:hypothetical protein
MPLPRLVPLSLVAAAGLALAACQKEPDPRLFQEKGTWTLIRFTDGVEWLNMSEAAEDAFLLRYDGDGEGVVAAATCTGFGNSHPKNTSCHTDPAHTWGCRCFSYIYEERNKMEWQEFAAGSVPPDVVHETGEELETGGVDTEGDPSVSIALGENEDPRGSFIYDPLPGTSEVYPDAGLFGSTGTTGDKFLFQRKADFLFDESGCADQCNLMP